MCFQKTILLIKYKIVISSFGTSLRWRPTRPYKSLYPHASPEPNDYRWKYIWPEWNNQSPPPPPTHSESRTGHMNGQPGKRNDVGLRSLRKLRRVWKTILIGVNCAVYNDMKVVFRGTVSTVRLDARPVDYGWRV